MIYSVVCFFCFHNAEPDFNVPTNSVETEASGLAESSSAAKQSEASPVTLPQPEQVEEQHQDDTVDGAQMEQGPKEEEDADDGDYNPADDDVDSEDELDRPDAINDEDATAIFQAIEASLQESKDEIVSGGANERVVDDGVREEDGKEDKRRGSHLAEVNDVTLNANSVRIGLPIQNLPVQNLSLQNLPVRKQNKVICTLKDVLTCSICHKSFDDASLTKQHVKETHDIYKKHACTFCDMRFFKPYGLRAHIKSKHSERVRKQCEKCLKVLLAKNFDAHVCTSTVRKGTRRGLQNEKQERKVPSDGDFIKFEQEEFNDGDGGGDDSADGDETISPNDNDSNEQVTGGHDVDDDKDATHKSDIPVSKESHQIGGGVVEVMDSTDSTVHGSSDKKHDVMEEERENEGSSLESEPTDAPVDASSVSRSSPDGSDAPTFKRKFGLTCNICQQTFDDPLLTKQHVEETHDIYKKHACTFCDMRYFKPFMLKSHIDNVHKGRNIKKKCNKCLKVILVKNFESHVCLRGSKGKPSKCTVCGRKFSTKTELKKHSKEHRISKYVPTMTRSRSRALQLRKNAVSFAAKQNVCTICNKRLSSHRSLKVHTKVMHEKTKRHFCDVCGEGFMWIHRLKRHSAIHDPSRVNKSQEEFPCTKCKKVYRVKGSFDKHVCREPSFKFHCKKCGQKCRTEALLESHENEVHKKIKSHFCDICGSGFVRRSDMLYHKRDMHSLATETKSIVCQLCNKKLSSHKTLRNHMKWMHESHEKKFKCSFCDKKFSHRGNMNMHIKTQHSAKREKHEYPIIQCSKCLKIYRFKASFEKHRCKESASLKFQCKLCGQRCTSEAFLKKHDNEFHKKIKSHFCDLCGSGFVKRSDMLRHQRIFHEGTEKYSPCDICGKIFTNRYLKIHRFNVHVRKQGEGLELEKFCQCEVCGKLFQTDRLLKAHMTRHQDKKEKCNFCDKVFRLTHELKIHVESVHLKLRNVLCSHCGKGFYSESNLREHVDTVHKKNKPHACHECNKRFYYRNKLLAHLKVHERRRQLKAKPRPTYPCDQCDLVCSSKSQLEIHKASHSTERNFKCDQCGNTYKTVYGLKTHRSSVHLKLRPHECQECDKKFFTKGALLTHVKEIHRQIRTKYPCSVCDKVFSTITDCNIHEDWHKGLIQLKCETCGKEFSTKVALHNHRKRHRDDAWRCSDCGKCFKTAQLRTKHQKQEHEGRWDWNRCNECDKEFATHNSLLRHMRNHQGGGFKCADCGLTFTTVYAKVKHRKEEHRGPNNAESQVTSGPMF